MVKRLSQLKYPPPRKILNLNQSAWRSTLLTQLEWILLFGWILFVTRRYLDFDPTMAPQGPEFLWAIETHYIWEWLWECGACLFWDGNMQGGYPSFANPGSSALHPLVIITTTLWDPLNGGKMALIGAFLLAGFGQWWLGWVLGAGRISRTWAAMVAVIAGHLTARVSQGALGLVISTASFVLVLTAFFYLLKERNWRAMVWLAVALAMLLVGGQGYIQVAAAALLGVSLVALWFVHPREIYLDLLKKFFSSVGIALLLASPFLIPFLNFLPNFGKDFDPNFPWSQPLGYVPLNLVIDDYDFYQTGLLSKAALPAHHILFVGWVPVALAVLALRRWRQPEQRENVLILSLMVLTAFVLASAIPSRLLITWFPWQRVIELVSGLRYTAYFAGPAVPALLGLAALGLEELFGFRWPRLNLSLDSPATRLDLDLKWIVLIFLVLTLRANYNFNARWMDTVAQPPEVQPVLDGLVQDDAQWVNLPFGELYWIQPALERGMKIGRDYVRTWYWRERDLPGPVLEANPAGEFPGMTAVDTIMRITIHQPPPGNEYARVVHSDGSQTVCSARSKGGNIDVVCDLVQPGRLVVREYSLSGWRVRVDDRPVPLIVGTWLTTSLESGQHEISFRYRPWDAPVGILMMIGGLAICVVLWRREAEDSEDSDLIERDSAGQDEL